jgi:hypothetical protein
MDPTQELQVYEATIIPAEKTAWGNTAAKELMKVVKEVGLSRKFGGDRPHLYAEAWQILGRFSGYHGIVDEPIEIYEEGKLTGFKAQAHVYDRAGVEVSRATSYCMRDEGNWKSKPMFQLASMAQTRALSKAYRLDLGWVAVLAGYSPTPAEEMDGVHPAPIPQPAKKSSPPASGEPTKAKPQPTLNELKAKAISAAKEFDFEVSDLEGWLEKKEVDWTIDDIDRIRDWYKNKKQESKVV